MNFEDLKAKIDAMPFEKVTEAGINSRISSVEYLKWPGTTLTLCNITLDNGFSIRGESACVDPRNYSEEIGKELAYRDAFSKIWAFEGYLLAERRFKSANSFGAQLYQAAKDQTEARLGASV